MYSSSWLQKSHLSTVVALSVSLAVAFKFASTNARLVNVSSLCKSTSSLPKSLNIPKSVNLSTSSPFSNFVKIVPRAATHTTTFSCLETNLASLLATASSRAAFTFALILEDWRISGSLVFCTFIPTFTISVYIAAISSITGVPRGFATASRFPSTSGTSSSAFKLF